MKKADRGELDSLQGGVGDPFCWEVGCYGSNGCDQPALEPGLWPTCACIAVYPTFAFSQCSLLPMLEASPVLSMPAMPSLPFNKFDVNVNKKLTNTW